MSAFKLAVFAALLVCESVVAAAAITTSGPLMIAPVFMASVFAGFGWAAWADNTPTDRPSEDSTP